MSDPSDPYAARRGLSFAQAEGAEPLPTQLRSKEVSKQLRALSWKVVYEDIVAIRETFGVAVREPWNTILRDWWINKEYQQAHTFSPDYHKWIRLLANLFETQNYLGIFDFLQFVISHKNANKNFKRALQAALEESRSFYRVVSGDLIAPIPTEQEAESVSRAFSELAASDLGGATSHLRAAAIAASGGDYPGSVRESIHAVESVAKILSPGSDTLGPALAELEKHSVIHGSLRKGFNSLYGFASDEKGIRHALLEDQAKVDEVDALYMLGACASFISYLVQRGRAAGLLK
jgi:hypothetical protein